MTDHDMLFWDLRQRPLENLVFPSAVKSRENDVDEGIYTLGRNGVSLDIGCYRNRLMGLVVVMCFFL
ncbi:hypothetical protein NDU88_006237 [Pleurodeles waltl]|uniref:Uncharacterized protein n=1 Tax=Pleurodeles waltl TaxID=8319 RepID=A0AAV7LQ54_PLEWA|nr:hypothetical protein NDU88_006237 [Pleurodeles waltl]